MLPFANPHTPGLLTDVALKCCQKHRADFVIVPCCYGQIAKRMAPEQTETGKFVGRSYFGSDIRWPACPPAVKQWETIARGSDFNAGPAAAFDPASAAFHTAKRCMCLVDTHLRAGTTTWPNMSTDLCNRPCEHILPSHAYSPSCAHSFRATPHALSVMLAASFAGEDAHQ